MMFSSMLVDGAKPLKLCKYCQRVFLSNRSNAEFCSPRCKNQYNVYKLGAKIRNPKNNIKKPSQQPQAAYCESQPHLVVDCYRNLIADRKIIVWHREKTIFLNFVNFTNSHEIGVNHIKPDHCVGKHLIAIKRRTVE